MHENTAYFLEDNHEDDVLNWHVLIGALDT